MHETTIRDEETQASNLHLTKFQISLALPIGFDKPPSSEHLSHCAALSVLRVESPTDESAAKATLVLPPSPALVDSSSPASNFDARSTASTNSVSSDHPKPYNGDGSVVQT